MPTREAQWLIHIVENLLSITRIGAGEDAQVPNARGSGGRSLRGLWANSGGSYPQIDVRVELPEDFFLVPMDPLLIQQVLTNLLENAAVHGVTTTQVMVSLGKARPVGPVHRGGQWPRHSGVSAAQPVRRHPERPEGRQHPQHGHWPVCVQNRGGGPPRQNKRRK